MSASQVDSILSLPPAFGHKQPSTKGCDGSEVIYREWQLSTHCGHSGSTLKSRQLVVLQTLNLVISVHCRA